MGPGVAVGDKKAIFLFISLFFVLCRDLPCVVLQIKNESENNISLSVEFLPGEYDDSLKIEEYGILETNETFKTCFFREDQVYYYYERYKAIHIIVKEKIASEKTFKYTLPEIDTSDIYLIYDGQELKRNKEI